MKKLIVAALLTVAGPVLAQTNDFRQITGEWANPKNSVHVRVQPCGGQLCGTVTWATPEAIAAAREGGTASLVGTQLFRQFRRESEGYFGGQVFVPDMNRTFNGTLRVAGPNAVVVRGCILGRIICKSQTWTRIG